MAESEEELKSLLMKVKERRTKEPLDEGERGEWKTWFKTQHSEIEDHGHPIHSLRGR